MIQTKAKDHSKYMKTTTHHDLTHMHKQKPPMSDGKKVLIFCILGLGLAVIIIGLALV